MTLQRDLPIHLIGAPCDVAAGTRGATMGPEALRVAGIAEALRGLGYAVTDRGNLSGPVHPNDARAGGYRHVAETATWIAAVQTAVAGTLAEGACPVLLGGDHALSVGSIAAAAAHCAATDRPLAVLWLDAHADFNTAETSPSGNLHGMPLALLCGLGPAGILDHLGRRPVLDARQVHALGIRSVDALEKQTVLAQGLRVHDMRRIDEYGLRAVLAEVLDALASQEGLHLHVSFDVDGLDPGLAPGVGTPVPGGLSYREAQLCMEMVHDSGLLGSLDVVEVNPARDRGNRTAAVAVELVESLFGEQILARML